MRNLLFDTMNRLELALRRGALDSVERRLFKQLESLPKSPFHIILQLSISNNPTDAARYFDKFLTGATRHVGIRAAYTEMNGFDINPDRWFCSVFGYRKNGGQRDFDWLSNWQAENSSVYEIKGLKRLQNVYASDAFHEQKYRDAATICGLLVVVKFQQFIKAASAHMKALQFPLYVTAHDYDFIAVVRPPRRA